MFRPGIRGWLLYGMQNALLQRVKFHKKGFGIYKTDLGERVVIRMFTIHFNKMKREIKGENSVIILQQLKRDFGKISARNNCLVINFEDNMALMHL
jgi:hypothetical protein